MRYFLNIILLYLKKIYKILAKRLTKEQKEKIIGSFSSGKTVDELSKEYNCTKLTISRNLKRNFGDKEFKILDDKNKAVKQTLDNQEFNSNINESSANKLNINKDTLEADFSKELKNDEEFSFSQFVEVTPLISDIENAPQQDFSSIPLSEVDFPKIVYMIVDKNIDLITKLLKEYPQWDFLSLNDLNRKTIEIHFDLKIAKRSCNKEQKVIKVPNTDVFRIVSPFLINRGITRIVCSEQLIAL